MKMKVSVDQDACIGCGLCEELAPKVFVLGDDMHAKPKLPEVDGIDLEKAREAEKNCPASSILVKKG